MSHRHISMTVPPKINPPHTATTAHRTTAFNGEFTFSTREKFRQIRRELGVSLQQLGDFLQINWSTIRKWETGYSKTCHARHISRITNFLNRDYDEHLRGLNVPNSSLAIIMRQVNDPLRTELEHAWTTYGVAQCYPGESGRLLRMLNSLVDCTARNILHQCLFSNAVNDDALEIAETAAHDYDTKD